MTMEEFVKLKDEYHRKMDEAQEEFSKKHSIIIEEYAKLIEAYYIEYIERLNGLMEEK